METTITIYDSATGAIKWTVTVDEQYADQQVGGGQDYIVGDFRNDKYCVDLQTRSAVELLPLAYHVDSLEVPADGISEIVLSQLPVITELRCGELKAQVTDGEARLAFTTPGTYQVFLRQEPPLCLPVVIELEAT